MTSLRAVHGHPVIVEDSAEQAGSVDSVVVDPVHATIQAVYLGGRGSSGRFISWTDVASFGADALMIKRSDAVHDSADELEQRTASGEVALLDRRVLTDTGDELGTLVDVEFSPVDGQVEQLIVDAETINADRLVGIGSYAVILTSPEDGHD